VLEPGARAITSRSRVVPLGTVVKVAPPSVDRPPHVAVVQPE
jgi:hypothetical protein